MTERELPQNVRDQEVADRSTRIFYGCIEGVVVIGYIGFGFFFITQGTILDMVVAGGFVGESAGFAGLSEHLRNKYDKRRQNEFVQEPEPTLVELLPRT